MGDAALKTVAKTRHETVSRKGVSIDDALKAVLEFETPSDAATTSQLAQALDVAPPTITTLLKRMHSMHLVEYTPYQGCRLKPEGRRIAMKLLRSHRIFETWLVQKLGFNLSAVDAEAERIEHALSDRIVDRMEELLGAPTHDPHGSPIPRRDLTWPLAANPRKR